MTLGDLRKLDLPDDTPVEILSDYEHGFMNTREAERVEMSEIGSDRLVLE